MSSGGGAIILKGRDANGNLGSPQNTTITQAQAAYTAIMATSPPSSSDLGMFAAALEQAITDATD